MRGEVPENAFCYSPPEPRLGEFDIGGVLYHARYFHLCEDAREKLLRDCGIPYSALVEAGFHLVIVETEQKFHQPLRYGQTFEAALWITELRRSTIVCRYRFSDTSGAALHTAMTKHVMVQKKGDEFQPARLSEALRAALTPYLVSAD